MISRYFKQIAVVVHADFPKQPSRNFWGNCWTQRVELPPGHVFLFCWFDRGGRSDHQLQHSSWLKSAPDDHPVETDMVWIQCLVACCRRCRRDFTWIIRRCRRDFTWILMISMVFEKKNIIWSCLKPCWWGWMGFGSVFIPDGYPFSYCSLRERSVSRVRCSADGPNHNNSKGTVCCEMLWIYVAFFRWTLQDPATYEPCSGHVMSYIFWHQIFGNPYAIARGSFLNMNTRV